MNAARPKLSLPGARGRDAHEARTEAVDGGRAQGLAAQRALEEEEERQDQHDRGDEDDQTVWPESVSGAGGEARVPEARVAKALGAEEDAGRAR